MNSLKHIMKYIKASVILIFLILMFTPFSLFAELTIESVSPTEGITGKDFEVTIKGSGFDENIKISLYQKIISASLEMGNRPNKIEIAGNFAYVPWGGLWTGALKIVNISNPSHPELLGVI